MTVKSGTRTDAIDGIGGRIKDAAQSTGLSLKDLAAEVGVAERTFLRYTGGHTLPPVDVLARIASVTGTTVGWLAVEDDEAPAPDEARGAILQIAAIVDRLRSREDDLATKAGAAGASARAVDALREAERREAERAEQRGPGGEESGGAASGASAL